MDLRYFTDLPVNNILHICIDKIGLKDILLIKNYTILIIKFFIKYPKCKP